MVASASERVPRVGLGGQIIERFVYWFGAALSLAHVYFNVIATLPELWVAAIHFAGFGLICLLLMPPVRNARRDSLLLAIDLLLAVLLGLSALYVILAEVPLAARGFDGS